MALDDANFLAIAFEEAKAGYDEGGIPVRTSTHFENNTWAPWFHHP
jgi:hypothetical protein